VLIFWAEKPPAFLPSWSGMFVVNAFVVAWMLVVGFGLGGWASVTNFVKQIDTFGLFAKCHQCPQVHTQRLGRRRRITS
jgi:auxin influx carrier (AUX1 LAX family)